MRLSQGGFHRFSENVCEFCCTSSFYQLCKETGDERGMDLTEEIKNYNFKPRAHCSATLLIQIMNFMYYSM